MAKGRFGRPEAVGLLFVLLALYGVLLIQYLHNRSFWIDEAMLSLNIIDRTAAGLLYPLDNAQVSPILFLFIEKLVISLFGDSELAFRLFPLLCAALALPIFYVLCRYLTNNRNLALCAIILLGLTPSFVYYSSEVKQYMVDLLILLVLYCLAFVSWPFLVRWRGLLLSVAGTIAIFLSNVSVIPLTVIGLNYVYGFWRTKHITPGKWIPLVVWMAFFMVNFFQFIYQHPNTAYMKDYWRNSFMPLNPFSVPFLKFTNKVVEQIFGHLVPSLPWGYLFLFSLIVYVCGLVIMVLKKDFRSLYLCLAPVVIHLALSALRLYPFELRMLLYQAPLFVLVMIYGIWNLVPYFTHRVQTMRVLYAISIVLLTFRIFLNFPINHDEIRPAIAYINATARPGESLYIFWGSTPATEYYSKRKLTKFDSLHVVWGTARSGSSFSCLRDLDLIKGPTWLLLSHLYAYNGDKVEVDKVIQNLKKRGRLLKHQHFYGSSVYQFDLH